jgi:CheY-like chemotaxis protein
MLRIRLVHWHEGEARERRATLEAAGFEVLYESLKDQSSLGRWREEPPDAVVIDLTRRPAQGRDLGLWLRQQKPTRRVPLVFVGGDSAKVDRVRGLLPDAVFVEWSNVAAGLARALRNPPTDPVVPDSVFAGYSGTPLPKKLGIKSGSTVALIGAPADFAATLGSLPKGASLRPSGRGKRDLTICFVGARHDLARRLPGLVKAAEQGHVWIAWPKKASGVKTDLTQTHVRRAGLDRGLVDFKICAIDDTWSGLCFARRKE